MIGCVLLSFYLHCVWIILKKSVFSEYLSHVESILDVFLWVFFCVSLYHLEWNTKFLSFCLASFLVTPFSFP